MRKVFFLFLFAGYFLSQVSLEAGEITASIEGETVRFKTDPRVWTLGFENRAGSRAQFEYTLPGEKVENWSELVTVNTLGGFQGEQGVAARFTGFTKQGIEKQCQKVDWKLIAEKKESVLYEWTAQECSGGWANQAEIALVLQGSNGLYVLHYASKKIPISPETRAVWIDLFSKAKTQ